MKDAILLELARRWELEAAQPEIEVYDNAKGSTKQQGVREAKRECADTLKTLVSMLGEPS